MGVGDEDYPSDYEPCGQCGFDHAYEPGGATAWHIKELECGHCFGARCERPHDGECSCRCVKCVAKCGCPICSLETETEGKTT